MAVSIFTKGIPELQRWRRGERQLHGKFNESVDLLNALVRGIDGPRQVMLRPGSQVAQEKLVVLRGYHNEDPGSFFVLVQEVKPSVGEDGIWTGGYEAFGETVKVNVWPFMVAGHFAPFVWEPEELTVQTTLLPLTLYDGVWYLKQQAKRAVARRQGPVKFLDCALPTEGV